MNIGIIAECKTKWQENYFKSIINMYDEFADFHCYNSNNFENSYSCLIKNNGLILKKIPEYFYVSKQRVIVAKSDKIYAITNSSKISNSYVWQAIKLAWKKGTIVEIINPVNSFCTDRLNYELLMQEKYGV